MRRPVGVEPPSPTNLSLPARIKRAAEMFAQEDGDTLTGMFSQCVRDRLKKRGLTLADPRFDPKEKK